MRILFVEDQISEQTPVVRYLNAQGYDLALIDNVFGALEYIKTSEPDILLCDYLLGNGPNGLVVAENTRNLYPSAAIVMISSYLTIENAVKAMQIGADDFIQRPVGLTEMLDRIWSAYTRHQKRYAVHTASLPASGPLKLDRQRRIALWEHKALALTVIEFALLAHLSSKPDQLVTFSDLWSISRGERLASQEARIALKPHISKLRAKLTTEGAPADIIRNVRGEGYIWSHI